MKIKLQKGETTWWWFWVDDVVYFYTNNFKRLKELISAAADELEKT